VDAVLRRLGAAMVTAAPQLMKFLSVAGTVAMFLVGGGILTHGVPALHHAIEALTVQTSSAAGPVVAWLAAPLANALFGLVAGALTVAVVEVAGRFWPRPSAA
jgi:predicted DNA repair protein MutK